jgi:hypothetical protein
MKVVEVEVELLSVPIELDAFRWIDNDSGFELPFIVAVIVVGL